MITTVAANWSLTEDILPMMGFIAALVAILMIPVRPGGSFSVAAKSFFAASVMCYIISTAASVYGHFGLFPAELEPVVTSIELLWVPLILFGVYALYSNQQLHDSIAARHEVVRAAEMLESVMDTAPTGVIMLDASGAITFANPEACRLLDMKDGAGAGDPTWEVCVGDDADESVPRRGDFRDLVGAEPLLNEPVTVSWPNGWRRRLTVNSTPFKDDSGDVAGAVAAFGEREPWTPRARVEAATSLD
jgi:PAS domain S-box-containing protein